MTEAGLREQHKQTTRRALEDAALRRFARDGFDQTSVDAIAVDAGVSPRTFFNYFTSKEEAMLGVTPSLPPDSAIAAFVAPNPDRHVLADLMTLVSSAAESQSDDVELHLLRKKVFRAHPHLLGIRVATAQDIEVMLVELIRRRIQADAKATGTKLSPVGLTERARILALIAHAGMRNAWATWIDNGGVQPISFYMRRSFSDLRAAMNGADLTS